MGGRRCCCKKCRCCRKQVAGSTECVPCVSLQEDDPHECCEPDTCPPPPCECCFDDQSCDDQGKCSECSFADRCHETGQCPTPWPECKCECPILSCADGSPVVNCKCPSPECPECEGGHAPGVVYATIPGLDCVPGDPCCGSCCQPYCVTFDIVPTNCRPCNAGGTFALFGPYQHHESFDDPTGACDHAHNWNYKRWVTPNGGTHCNGWRALWSSHRVGGPLAVPFTCCAPVLGCNPGCDWCDVFNCPTGGWVDELNIFAWGNGIFANYQNEGNGVRWYLDVSGYGLFESEIQPYGPHELINCFTEVDLWYPALSVPWIAPFQTGPAGCIVSSRKHAQISATPPA